jgi:multidrug efflux pump subunit AcrA (membrane-fusion protein)
MIYRNGAVCLLLVSGLGWFYTEAGAQPAPGAPPAVGVVRAEREQITQTDEFIGRIQAVNRVAGSSAARGGAKQ